MYALPRLFAGDALGCFALTEPDAGSDPGNAKATAEKRGDTYVTTECVQNMGGAGYMREQNVERMFRDAKITQIYEGTNEIQRMIISKNIFK